MSQKPNGIFTLLNQSKISQIIFHISRSPLYNGKCVDLPSTVFVMSYILKCGGSGGSKYVSEIQKITFI